MCSAKPKFMQVEDFIRNQIKSGLLEPGDRIPTEEELCDRFGFSRMTINKAIGNLASSGLIKRISGKGSFVSGRHVDNLINLNDSFTQGMERIGLKPGAKLLSYEVIQASVCPEKVRKDLILDNGDLVHHFVRLRTGDGTPFAINDTFISSRVVPAIDVSYLNGSLYEYLRSIGCPPGYMDLTISALLPDEMQKELLDAGDAAILCSSHVTYTDDSRMLPFEYTSTYYNGNMYTYRYHS